MKRAKIFGGILLFLVALVFLLPYLISAEKFRPAIQNQLQSALGRRVEFGDLTFRLIPLSLRASALKVEGLGTVELLDVRARLLPLLSGDLDVASLVLTRPAIEYTDSKSADAKAELPASIEIIDGKLTLTNAQRERSEFLHIDAAIHTSGRTSSGSIAWKNGTLPVNLNFSATDNNNIWAVSRLDAVVGAVTAAFTGAIDANASTVDGALTIKPTPLAGIPLNSPYKPTGTISAEVKVNGPIRQPGLTGVVHLANLEVTGGQLSQPLRATALQLDLTPTQITAKPFALHVGPTQVQAAFKLTNYTATPTIDADVSTRNASIPDLLVIARIPDISATGTASFQVHAAGPLSKPLLSGSGTLSNADCKVPALKPNVKIDSAEIKFEDDAVALENATIHIGKTTAKGSIRYHDKVTLALALDQLSNADLQSWMPESKPGAAPPKLSVTGDLSIGKFFLDGLVLESVKTTLNLRDQILTLDPLSASGYGGRLSGSVSANMKVQPTVYSVKTHLDRVESQQLLDAVSSIRNVVSGPITADAQLQFAPKPGEDIARSLDGVIDFQLAQGKLIPFNILGEMNSIGRFLKPVSAAGGNTAFLCMKGQFRLNKGVADTKDLRLELDRAYAQINGAINLNDQSLNLRMLTTLNKQLSDEVGGSKIGGFLSAALANQKGELLMPSLVKGTLAKPVFTPDAATIGTLKLSQPASIQEGVQGIMDLFRPKKK